MSQSRKFVLGLSLVLLAGCAAKPIVELQQARETLAAALDLEADIYAPNEFELAKFNLEGAEFAIAEQDQAPAWRRNYRLSLEYLALAIEQAEQAQRIAESNKANVFEEAQNGRPIARMAFQAALESVEAARRVPVTRIEIESFDDELTGIFATLNQAEEIYNGGDYSGALILLKEVQERSQGLELLAQTIGGLVDQ